MHNVRHVEDLFEGLIFAGSGLRADVLIGLPFRDVLGGTTAGFR